MRSSAEQTIPYALNGPQLTFWHAGTNAWMPTPGLAAILSSVQRNAYTRRHWTDNNYSDDVHKLQGARLLTQWLSLHDAARERYASVVSFTSRSENTVVYHQLTP